MKKKFNQKLRTFQAFDYAEKSEIENLFLDCIDHCKREHYKQDNQKTTIIQSNTNDKTEGTVYSVNGTIKAINLNPAGKGLKQRLLVDKDALISIFEEIFGHNKPPMYEMDGMKAFGTQGQNRYQLENQQRA